MDGGQDFARAFKRERLARKEAESLLESKSLELFRANGELQARNEALERLNQELETTHSQLLQSEKMASIGQLAAGVAHEINNPVGFVTSNVRTLEHYVGQLLELIGRYQALGATLPATDTLRQAAEGYARQIDFDYLRDDIRQLITESTEGLDRVRRIVLDLRDFSRAGDTDDWAMANVETGLEKTINIVWHELKYKAEIERAYGKVPDIECQPAKLNQVFLNLLVNAGHAVGTSGGKIRIATGRTDNGWVWVEVSDNGCGIDADKISRIFDPFFTTKPVGQGTGLGLSLSYGIVEKHNGHIEVVSKPGEGTRFRVWLPEQRPTDRDQ